MLTEKDYCDYETCVALKEVGFDIKCHAYFEPIEKHLNIGSFKFGWRNSEMADMGCITCPTLYEAQKWLREEKEIQIEIPVSFMDNGVWKFCFRLQTREFYDRSLGEWDIYEEALTEGIRRTINILKEK